MEKTINDIIREKAESEEPKEEKCCMCGRSLEHTLEGWKEQGLCSGRCWAELFGEENY